MLRLKKHSRRMRQNGEKMKKLLSIILAAAMLVSCLAVFAVSVAADDAAGAAGEWNVFAGSDDYPEPGDTSGIINPLWRSIAGKKYTDDGVELDVPENLWADYSPRATLQTKTAVNLRDGVYLKLRVDDFTWDASDKWIQFQLFSDTVDQHDEMKTYSWITFRPDAAKKITQCYVVTSAPGTTSMTTGTNVASSVEPLYDDEGNMIIEFTITYNKGTYNININGTDINPDVVAAFSEHIEDLDGRMYVGVAAQNNVKNGVVDFTILKYGKTAADAKVPVGNDNTAPVVRENKPAAASDPTKVADGQPALWLNGSTESDIAFKLNGNVLLDNSVRMKFDGNQNWFSVTVTNDKTYMIEDFPYAMFLLRNYCTCEWNDVDGDWEITKLDAECTCEESISSGVIVGDIVQGGEYNLNSTMSDYLGDIVKIGEDFYSYFVVDYTSGITAGDYGGRINGISMNMNKFRSNEDIRNEFDLVGIGFFKSTEDIEAFFADKIEYYEELDEKGESFDSNAGNNDNDETTEAPVDETTEAPVDGTTEAPVDETTEAPADETTEAPADDETTEAPKTTEAPTDGGDDVSVGCGGVVGVGAIAVIALAGAGFVSFRKKED